MQNYTIRARSSASNTASVMHSPESVYKHFDGVFLFVCFVFWPGNGVFNSRTMFPCHCFAYITLKMTITLLMIAYDGRGKHCRKLRFEKIPEQICKGPESVIIIIHVALNIIMYSVFFDVNHIFWGDFKFVPNFLNLAKGSKRVKRYF